MDAETDCAADGDAAATGGCAPPCFAYHPAHATSNAARSLTAPPPSSLIAVGDVHGNLEALNDLLDQLTDVLAERDTVVFLGDYIDRGRDSKGCVERILSFREGCSATVVCLRGNHEDWMLRTKRDHARHSWLTGMDAFTTIRSYSPEAEQIIRAAIGEAGLQLYLSRARLPYERFFAAMPESHTAFFDRLAVAFASDGCVCSHAGVDPRVSAFGDQREDALLWGAKGFPEGYREEPILIYGHWNNAELDSHGWPSPRIVGNTIGIDTIAHGVLTALRMPDRRVFQSARYRGDSED